jgi:hypothetical protein
MDRSLLGEFQLDWTLAGKSKQTAKNYVRGIELLLEAHPDPALVDVKQWLSSITSTVSRRKRAQAVRAFGAWAQSNEYEVFDWWQRVPLVKETRRPQASMGLDTCGCRNCSGNLDNKRLRTQQVMS